MATLQVNATSQNSLLCTKTMIWLSMAENIP